MNPAPAHLEHKLRPIWDFTVAQLAGLVCGFLIGMAWWQFLCPFGGVAAAVSGVYIGALPALPAFLASQTDFDLWLLVRGALGWRRREGRYVPGPGETPTGYRTEAPPETNAGGAWMQDLNLQALWEDA